MFDLSLENAKGDSITLTNSLDYAITDIDGLYPPSANIVTSETALFDGAKFVSSKVNTRQMEIAISIQRNAEKNRIALYKVIKTKQYIKMNYKNGERDVFIEGYVSDMEIDFFANMQTVTVSILCPEPYFKEAEEIIESISSIIGVFVFPFSIPATAKIPIGYYTDVLEINVINDGDVECGMTIEIHANGDVTNPTIFNRDTGEFFGLVTQLEQGDTVYITTTRGNKEVQLLRDGEYTNLFNSIEQGSSWLQLAPGDNVFTYEADSDTTNNMAVRFAYRNLFEGV